MSNLDTLITLIVLNLLYILTLSSDALSLHSECDKPSELGFNYL